MTAPTPPLFWADEPSVDHPFPGLVSESILVWRREFCNEVYQSLRFNGCFGMVFNFKLTEFDSPLDHSFGRFGLLHGFLDRLVHHHQDRICLEILS